jgi:hypothetical protein
MAERPRMTAAQLADKLLADEHADVLREAVAWMAARLMESDVAARIGAELGERTSDRLTHRNGSRPRTWDGAVAFATTALSSETADMRMRRPPPAPVPCSTFSGFRFPPDVIVIAVRWYLRFGLSYRDVEELLGERGVEVDHVTVYRWVQRFTPLLAEAARPCRHVVGDRWLVDETYVKVAGRWRYLYRGIDQFGQVIDVFVSPRRDARAAPPVLRAGSQYDQNPAG